MINEHFVILYKKNFPSIKPSKGLFSLDAMSDPQQYHFEPYLIKYEGFTCFTYTL